MKLLKYISIIYEVLKLFINLIISFVLPFLVVRLFIFLIHHFELLNISQEITMYISITFGAILVHFLSPLINRHLNLKGLNNHLGGMDAKFNITFERENDFEYKIFKKFAENRIVLSNKILNTDIFSFLIYLSYFIILTPSYIIEIYSGEKIDSLIIYSFATYFAYDQIRSKLHILKTDLNIKEDLKSLTAEKIITDEFEKIRKEEIENFIEEIEKIKQTK